MSRTQQNDSKWETARVLAGGLRSFKLSKTKMEDSIVGVYRPHSGKRDQSPSVRRSNSSDRLGSGNSARRKNTWCNEGEQASIEMDPGAENRAPRVPKPKKLKSSSSLIRMPSLDLVLKSAKSSNHSPKIGSPKEKGLLTQNFFDSKAPGNCKSRNGSKDSNDLTVENFS